MLEIEVKHAILKKQQQYPVGCKCLLDKATIKAE